MKTLRFIGVALFTVLMSVSFSACGGSDDDDNNGGGDTPSVSKHLVKITMQEGNNTFCNEYTYDSNGRVVKVVNKKNGNDSGHTIYTYTDNLIVKEQYYTGSNTVSETRYELENGLIAKKTYGGKNINYTYDNGYLATLTRSKGGALYNFTWKDGNILNKKSADSEAEDSYEYTSYSTPQNFIYLDYIDDVDSELASFYGKSPKNLPSKRIEVNLYDEGSSNSNEDGIVKVTDTTSYDWTMKDGLPIKLIITEDTYIGPSTMLVDFEWE